MPSKKSGGKRAAEKKHLEQDAARNRSGNYEAKWRADYRKLVGKVPYEDRQNAFVWLVKALLFAADRAMTDPGLSPEGKIERLVRIAPQLVKALEPAKITEELNALYDALQKGKAGRDAAQVASGQAEGAPTSTPVQ